MSAITVAFMGALVYSCPELLDVLQEHLDEQEGEFLPHLLISDVGRWTQLEVASGRISPGSPLFRVLAHLEDAHAGGNPEIQELIHASFIEELPRPGEPGAELREMVGPHLAAQLEIIG